MIIFWIVLGVIAGLILGGLGVYLFIMNAFSDAIGRGLSL